MKATQPGYLASRRYPAGEVVKVFRLPGHGLGPASGRKYAAHERVPFGLRVEQTIPAPQVGASGCKSDSIPQSDVLGRQLSSADSSKRTN